MNICRTLPLVSLIALLGATATGCDFVKDKIQEKIGEKIAEEVMEQATGAEDVDIEDGKLTIKDKDGKVITTEQGKDGKLEIKSSDGTKVTFGGAEVPKDFPLPIVDHKKVLSTSDFKNKKSRTRTVMIEAKSTDGAAIAKIYEEAFAKLKLEQSKTEMNNGSGNLIMLTAKNEDGSIQAAVQIMPLSETKSINVNVHYITKQKSESP